MKQLRGRVACLPLLLIGTFAPFAQAQAPVVDVLRAMGEFVATWERELNVMVAEEQYSQQADRLDGLRDGLRELKLRSDLSLIPDAKSGWVAFRDVFEVNGVPVREREVRLTALFLKPDADLLNQAKRIAAEGARHNLNAEVNGRVLARTINTPVMIIKYLRELNQSRSVFTSEGVKTIDGVQTVVLSFQERTVPRLIDTVDDAPAKGRVWVAMPSGRVMRSELAIETVSRGAVMQASVIAEYGLVTKLKLWAPLKMEDDGVLKSEGRVAKSKGRATYSKFRQFSVDVTTIIKK